jgi:16S rRNA (guanine(966)-N(2))-methyltransferase RsmD
MRIIAGTLKGRRLQGPEAPGLRPTSDGLRETLFNVLGSSIEGARVLDAFAGTGAVGLEALSRGAAHATFVERDRRALAGLGANVRHCGVEDACAIIRDDFFRAPALAPRAFDLVFLDPPYEGVDLEAAVERGAPLVAPGGRLVLEHSRRRPAPDRAGPLTRVRGLVAGDSALAFYE